MCKVYNENLQQSKGTKMIRTVVLSETPKSKIACQNTLIAKLVFQVGTENPQLKL